MLRDVKKKKLENFPLPLSRDFVFYSVVYPEHVTMSVMYFVLSMYLLNDTFTQRLAVKG